LKCRMRPLRKTIAAMRQGVPVIVQAALADGGWLGRADILRRRQKPSAIGARSRVKRGQEVCSNFVFTLTCLPPGLRACRDSKWLVQVKETVVADPAPH
jgi:hypothetical protein